MSELRTRDERITCDPLRTHALLCMTCVKVQGNFKAAELAILPVVVSLESKGFQIHHEIQSASEQYHVGIEHRQ